ncbi:MAG TPA: O-methyltransferase [Chitinophagaceae bacterium]|nr:O-methyltransferase [Chitinophagaceae bacterium]
MIPEDLLHPSVYVYAERFTTPEDDLLREVAAYTQAHHPRAHMLSGHLQGGLLKMISHMIRPKRILEIGTFTGYSALCLAAGLAEGGELHTVELREEEGKQARRFFDRSVFSEQIILHIGEALPLIGELGETWDLVFIDADKENYTAYFNRVLPFVRVNGFILADNTLFHGQVLGETVKGKSAKAIQAFNEQVRACTDVETVLLPVRDGLTLIRKVKEAER